MADNNAPHTTPDDAASWVDLYDVLGLPSDSDDATLRVRINALFTEANSNYDHRNAERRRHYHALKDEYLPQCRRVLLRPELRSLYDNENELQKSGIGQLTDVAQFLSLHEGQEAADGGSALPTAANPNQAPPRPTPQPRPTPKPAPQKKAEKPPVEKEFTLEELEDDGPRRKKGGRALSDTSRMILAAIVGVLLYSFIQYSVSSKNVAPARAPLVVAYSSELRPVMEAAKVDFEKSQEGAGSEIVLQSLDSRDGMFAALGKSNALPAVWIPSESLWSKRYNAVAGENKRRSIDNPAPLAMSPIVLVARRDHSAILLKQFPSRIIGSWEGLRSAVGTGAAQHFGIADPTKSGVGATPRYFMARDWCRRNNVPWNVAAAKSDALWKWLQGFEDNVPYYESKSSNMVQDLALGTTSRYWWVLAFESDAIHWLQEGKALEVFYLPQTNYGDHPFCHVPPAGSEAQINVAGKRLEEYLKTDKMQRLLLKNGFRPLNIDFTVASAGNPFTDAKVTKHGVKAAGFNSAERFDYDILNKLAAEWSTRCNK